MSKITILFRTSFALTSYHKSHDQRSHMISRDFCSSPKRFIDEFIYLFQIFLYIRDTISHIHYLASIAFHRFSTLDLAVIRIAITPLHSLLFSWSVTLVRTFCLRFHLSISLSGPAKGSNLQI